MQITVRRLPGAAVIEIEGNIDIQHSPEVRKVILENLEKSKPVIVNLSKVHYIDSSGIASLVEGLRKAKDVKGRFILVGPTKAARELFELTRLITVFEIYDTEDQALNALSGVKAEL